MSDDLTARQADEVLELIDGSARHGTLHTIIRQTALELLRQHLAAALADPAVHPNAKSLAGYMLGYNPDTDEGPRH